MFYSSSEKKLVTLAEYKERMKEDQKYIYYACGETVEKIDRLPQTEMLRDRGFEILYCTDDVDEFALRMMRDFDGKEFRSVSDKDLGIEDAGENEAVKEKAEENKELLRLLKDDLEGKVKDVRLSTRLKSHPVCLSADGGVSIEMEKVLNSMPGDQKVQAERVLELNPDHPVFETLRTLFQSDADKLKTYAGLLYNQALLIEGLPIEDPVAFSNAICDLMAK